MKPNKIQYTQDYLETLGYAGALALSKGRKTIFGEDIFY
jgi:histone H3/H4